MWQIELAIAMNDGEIFVHGIHSIVEKLRANPDDVLEIIMAQDSLDKAGRELYRLAKKLQLPLRVEPRTSLDRLAHGVRHQGALAKLRRFEYWSDAELFNAVAPPEWTGCVVVLDGLTDPHNFGAIARTAEAVGVQHVLIPKDRSVGVTATVIKTSAGAVHHLRISKTTNLRRALARLKTHGFWVAALCADAKEVVFDRIYPPKVCFVIGSEGEGIRPLIRRECDFEVAIPLCGKTASLNASVAAAIFLYELVRQKHATERKNQR